MNNRRILAILLIIAIFASINRWSVIDAMAINGGDDFDSAVTLSVDTMVNVEIAVSQEKRYFKFIPQYSGFYTIQSSANEGDPYLWFYNRERVLLMSNDDGAGLRNFTITYHFVENVVYYFVVGCYSTGTGDYSMSISPTQDATKISSTLVTESLFYSSLGVERFGMKCYKFIPTVSGQYLLQSSYMSGDPKVWLYNGSLDNIGVNDDGGEAYNFRLTAMFEAGQTYYIVVGNINLSPGSFTTTVMRFSDFENRFYHIQNIGSSKYLDIHGPNAQEFVHQWTTSVGEQQKWLVQKQSDGYYTIRSQYGNNYYVGISNINARENNIKLFSTISDSTRWNVYTTYDGKYIFEPKLAVGKALFAPDAGTGTEMQLVCMQDGGQYIKWSLLAYTYSGFTFSAFDIGNSETDEVAIIESYFEGIGYTDIGTYKNTEGFVSGRTIVDVGRYSDVVYINGHGGDGAALWVQNGSGSVVEYVCADQSVDTGNDYEKTSICSEPLTNSTISDSYWNERTKWVILAQCDQLNYGPSEDSSTNQDGLYNAQLWLKTMLGDGHRIHGILGYYKAAPPSQSHIDRLERFLENADSMTILEAWKKGHTGLLLTDTNWAMMYYGVNGNDYFDYFTATASAGSDIYIVRREAIETQRQNNQVSTSNMTLYASERYYPLFVDETYADFVQNTYKNLLNKLQLSNNCKLYIDENNVIKYNTSVSYLNETGMGMVLSDDEIVAYAISELDKLGLMPKEDYRATISCIKRYKVNAYGNPEEAETIEYTVCFYRTYNGVDLISNEEDGIIVSFNKYGLTELQYKWRDVKLVEVDSAVKEKTSINSGDWSTKPTKWSINDDYTFVRIAYMQVEDEVLPVLVYSTSEGYGDNIFVNINTGEEIHFY